MLSFNKTTEKSNYIYIGITISVFLIMTQDIILRNVGLKFEMNNYLTLKYMPI